MKIIKAKEYRNAIEEIVYELEKIMSVSNVAYILSGHVLMTERLLTSLRQVTSNSGSLKKVILSQILEAAYKTEKAGPNSTQLFMQLVIDMLKYSLDRKNINFKTLENRLDNTYKNVKQELEKESKKQDIKWSEIKKCVFNTSMDERIANMTLDAIDLAGLEGKIYPSWTPKGVYSVELIPGYNFSVTTYPIFTDQNGRWERKNVKCLIVDGTIEKESEVHRLFMKLTSEKSPLLIVARGYGEEIIATIAANTTLDICPIRIPFELESINLIADIGVVSGGNVVSSMKGDMISMVKYDDLPTLDQVICTKQNLNIINVSTTDAVKAHYNDLTQRRNEVEEHLEEFIDKRIKSLVSHTVHMRLGSKTEQEKIKELEAVDFSLRMVKGILQHGAINAKKYGLNDDYYPIISILSAYYYSNSLIKNLFSVEIAILNF